MKSIKIDKNCSFIFPFSLNFIRKFHLVWIGSLSKFIYKSQNTDLPYAYERKLLLPGDATPQSNQFRSDISNCIKYDFYKEAIKLNRMSFGRFLSSLLLNETSFRRETAKRICNVLLLLHIE